MGFKKRVVDYYNRSDVIKMLSTKGPFNSGYFSTHALARPRTVSKMVAPHLKGRILNVGIGSGPLTEKLRKSGEVVGVDVSLGLLKKAKKRGAEPILADAENLPFKAESFDSAVCMGTLGHLENPEKALREMHRTLKPNAPIVVTVAKDFYAAELSSERMEAMGGPPFTRYSEEEIKELVEKSGFEVKDIVRKKMLGLSSELFVYAKKKSTRD